MQELKRTFAASLDALQNGLWKFHSFVTSEIVGDAGIWIIFASGQANSKIQVAHKFTNFLCINIMRIHSLLSLIMLSWNWGHAQSADSIYVSQFVRDSFTRHGIKDAVVTVIAQNGKCDTLRTFPGKGNLDAQLWQMLVPRRESGFRIKLEHPDYETKEMEVEMKHPARLNSYRFPEVLMKRRFEERTTTLNEATATVTRVKLCYKGDTIEVDARAFKLTEGSMLESLVRNVPGCELLDNGDVYMNGRKVDYLTLNGKDFFKGNNRIMLDNLPYYTVDKLQFYNQRSERSQMIGKDVERPDFVMNVKLKREYSTGYLANVEAGGGTHERWLGRAFALRFTDNSRFSLFGNANNINETGNPSGQGVWGSLPNPVGDIKTYDIGSELLVDDKQGRYKNVLNTSVQWSESEDEQRTASRQFLRQGDVFGYADEKSSVNNFAVKASNRLTLKPIGLVSESRLDYSSYDKSMLSRGALLASNPSEGAEHVIDSIFAAQGSSELMGFLINRVRDEASSDGHQWNVSQKLDFHKQLPWGDDLMLTAQGTWDSAKGNGRSRYGLEYTDEMMSDDIQKRVDRTSSHAYELQFDANYAVHFLTGWHLNVEWGYRQSHQHEQKDLYRLDWDENFIAEEWLPSMTGYAHLRDEANSPHYVSTKREEAFSGMLHRHDSDSKRGRYFSFNAAFDLRHTVQDGTYTRGDNRFSPSDTRWLFNPRVDVEYQTRQWHDTYSLHYDTRMNPLNLAQIVDLTDTSDPLSVQKGNQRLRPSQVHHLSALYSTRFGTHGQFLMLRSSVSFMQHLVAMNSIYDAASGAYTYIPVNVDGNWNCTHNLNLRRSLAAHDRLTMESRTTYRYTHGVDMKDNATSTVMQHTIGEDVKVEYKQGPFVCALLGGISYRNVRPDDANRFQSVDFNYGASVQASLPLGFRLSSDIRMYCRRGYTDRSLCTDRLVWNAQLARSFCRGRLQVAARAFDLLHQLSSTHTVINTQAQTEVWQLSLPSYLMLSVQLKLNKSPKGK